VNWIKKYSGLQFAPDGRDWDGVDCWGLVYMVYKHTRGINLPDFRGIFTASDQETYIKIHEVMAEERKKWDDADTPQEFDMLHFRTGRHAFHVGIAIDQYRFLHVDESTEYVVMDDLRNPLWLSRLDRISRYNDACQR
jgi:cell wall-associated NlpC family hydrolase